MSQQLALLPANQATDRQLAFLNTLRVERGFNPIHSDDWAGVTKRRASELIDYMKALPRPLVPAAPLPGPLDHLPVSKYAVEEQYQDDNGLLNVELVFCEVREWKGRRYFRVLIGAPGDWRRERVTYPRQQQLVRLIEQATSKEAALRYSREFTRCAACESPLSDPESRARGFGPVCWQRY